MSDVVIVIPCFNEARRLDPDAVLELASGDVRVLLVDDGSTDGTAALIAELASEHPERIDMLAFRDNRGKGEAVRSGLLVAAGTAGVVGYCDADFATPPAEMHRLLARMREANADVLIGSRQARPGADIRRRVVRHYLGRIFAAAAAATLGQWIYDTQCGAKLFRTGPILDRSLTPPFQSRWAFDVELLGRLIAEGVAIDEIPLEVWHDIGESKVSPTQMVKAGLDLVAIRRALRRRAQRP